MLEYQNRRRLGSAICVFECNACLVGAVKTVAVSVKNIGRPAKFICVPEDVWYTQPVGVSKKRTVIKIDVHRAGHLNGRFSKENYNI